MSQHHQHHRYEKYLNQLNQKRMQKDLRILWPDYQIQSLLEQNVLLTNLASYCFYEKFMIISTNFKEYLQCVDLYGDYTHVFFTVGESGGKSLQNVDKNEWNFLENQRKKSFEKKCQQIYVILSKRVLTIDQIIRTQHKIAIAIAPLSSLCHLWGGSLTYEQFQKKQIDNDNNKLFNEKMENSFGFNFMDGVRSPNKNRKSGRFTDKRQMRFSNYYNNEKSTQQIQQQNEQSQHRDCPNNIKIYPHHIKVNRNFLYIEIDLSLSSGDYNFDQLIIYGRRKKPIYGAKYQEESDDDDDVGKRYQREEIFNVYSMKWRVFGSFINKQINKKCEYKQLSFRGSGDLFSTLKSLEIKNQQIKDKTVRKSRYQFSRSLSIRNQVSDREQKVHDSLSSIKSKQKEMDKYERETQMKKSSSVRNKKMVESCYKVEKLYEHYGDNSVKDNIFDCNQKESSIRKLKEQICEEIVGRLKQSKQSADKKAQTNEIVYISVHAPNSFRAQRYPLYKSSLLSLNQSLPKKLIKSQPESSQPQLFISDKIHKQSQIQTLQQILAVSSSLELADLVHEKLSQHELNKFIRLFDDLELWKVKNVIVLTAIEIVEEYNWARIQMINQYVSGRNEGLERFMGSHDNGSDDDDDERVKEMIEKWFMTCRLYLFQGQQNSCIKQCDRPVRVALFNFFLLNSSHILLDHVRQFQSLLQTFSHSKNFFTQMFTYSLSYISEIPSVLLSNTDYDQTKCKMTNHHIVIVSDLLAYYNKLINNIRNVVELIKYQSRQLEFGGYFGDFVATVWGKQNMRWDMGDKEYRIVVGRSLLDFYEIKNIKHQGVSHNKQVQFEKKQQSYENHYESSLKLTNLTESALPPNSNFSIISPSLTLKNSKNPLNFPTKNHNNFNFMISFIKSHETDNYNKIYFSMINRPEIESKLSSFESHCVLFNVYRMKIIITINMEVELQAKMVVNFYRNQDNIVTCKLKGNEKLNKLLIKFMKVEIFYSKCTLYESSLRFLSLRLPKYLKAIEKKIVQQQIVKKQKNLRKTIGGRITEHLNRRKSVALIQKDFFQNENQTENQHTIYDLPEQAIYDLLRIDRNYIQHEQRLLRFIQERYMKSSSKYEDEILYLGLRIGFIRMTEILKRYLEKPTFRTSRILKAILSYKLNSFEGSNDVVCASFIDRPRVASVRPLRNVKNTKEQSYLLNRYFVMLSQMRQKETSFSKPKKTSMNLSNQVENTQQNSKLGIKNKVQQFEI